MKSKAHRLKKLDISHNQFLFKRIDATYVDQMKKTAYARESAPGDELGLAGRLKGGVDSGLETQTSLVSIASLESMTDQERISTAQELWDQAVDLLHPRPGETSAAAFQRQVEGYACMARAHVLEPTRLYDDALVIFQQAENASEAYRLLQQELALNPYNTRAAQLLNDVHAALEEQDPAAAEMIESLELRARKDLLKLDLAARRLAAEKITGHWAKSDDTEVWVSGPWEKMTWLSRLTFVLLDEDAQEVQQEAFATEAVKYSTAELDEDIKMRQLYAQNEHDEMVKKEEMMDSRGWASFCTTFCMSAIEEFTATHIDWGPRQLEIFSEAISWKDATGKLCSNPALKRVTVASTTNVDSKIELDSHGEYLTLVDAGLSPAEGPLLQAWLEKRRPAEVDLRLELSMMDDKSLYQRAVDAGTDNQHLDEIDDLPASAHKTHLIDLIVSTEIRPKSPPSRSQSPHNDSLALRGVNLSRNRGLFGMQKDEDQTWVPDVHLKAFRSLCAAAFTCAIKEMNLVDTGMGSRAVRTLSSRRLFSEQLEILTLSSSVAPQLTTEEIAAEGKAADVRKSTRFSPPWPKRGIHNGAGYFTLEICQELMLTGAGLSSADMPVISAWIAKPEMSGNELQNGQLRLIDLSKTSSSAR
eukprot:COSAG06_NODE_2244_length_7267_cov_1.778739_1_plen_642_part_10